MMTWWGVCVVTFAGLVMGSAAWPIKLVRRYQFEHWWLVSMMVGLVVMPWTIALVWCPNAMAAIGDVPTWALIKGNLCGLSWGIANVLWGLSFMRIGIALTGAIVTGLGVSMGVTIPMVVKGSGLFQDAPGLRSPAGLAVLLGVAVMLAGVALAARAGFGRDHARNKQQQKSGSFLGGFLMAAAAGILSCGLSFAFVYTQEPVVAAMKAHGAGDIPANFAVWAIGLTGAALINLIYPVYLITKRKSWNVFGQSWKEAILSAILGINFSLAVALMGKGMLVLGVLGASVGFGVQQATQMTGNQVLGFISGEWRGVHGKPRHWMYLAIVILIVAAMIMAYGNTLAKA